MEKLNNMKVKKKLLSCFIFVTVLSSISGIAGTISLMKLDNDYGSALVENGFSQGKLGNFNTYLNKGSAVVRDIIMYSDKEDIESSKKELEDITDKTNDALAETKDYCKTQKEQEYIQLIEEKLNEYRILRDEVVELGVANKDDEALSMFHEKARPVLNEAMTAAQEMSEFMVTTGNEVSSALTLQSRITLVGICAVIILTFVLSIVIALNVAKMFSVPLNRVKDAAGKMAKGELDIEVAVASEDEIGEMSRSFNEAAHKIRSYVSELDRGFGILATGNFDISTEVEFEGDFVTLKNSMEQIAESMNETLTQINEGADQVAVGASQMAENAQALAEGATDQAGAVEELTATIQNVTESAEESAHKSNEAYRQAHEFEKQAQDSSEEMQNLTAAMERINVTSKEIENIIAEIEDIASQTNLLSLNASIEAARAGEAGRGFAVVADQIGKLASDSAQSAVHTRELIGKSIEEITNGNSITERTAEALEKVTEGIKMLAEASKTTSELFTAQAETMHQIENGVEQISSVVQNNSAAAEEASATSEELSAQSQALKGLIGQFKLMER